MLIDQKNTISLLKKYSISYPKTTITDNVSKINLKFPLALKIDSPEVIHKSDLGLVYINIKDKKMLYEKAAEAKKILESKKIKVFSYIVQEMVSGTELMMGMKRDKVFGPVIMFGLGGIFVEVLKDVSMRIAPLTEKDCYEMMDEIKAKKLLDGYRNTDKVDKDRLVDMLMSLSALSVENPNISEIDFNPVLAKGKKAVVVDARLIEDA